MHVQRPFDRQLRVLPRNSWESEGPGGDQGTSPSWKGRARVGPGRPGCGVLVLRGELGSYTREK